METFTKPAWKWNANTKLSTVKQTRESGRRISDVGQNEVVPQTITRWVYSVVTIKRQFLNALWAATMKFKREPGSNVGRRGV